MLQYSAVARAGRQSRMIPFEVQSDQAIKHLELVQAVITRMGQNSFAVKAWAVGLSAAALALASADTSQWAVPLIGLLPAIVFWGLDGYYLRQEKLFRRLYDAVREGGAAEFSMNTSPYSGSVMTWWRVCWSRTIAPLYGIVAFALSLAAVALLIVEESPQ